MVKFVLFRCLTDPLNSSQLLLSPTTSETLQDAPENAPEDAPEDALKDALEDALEENYNQYTLEGDYNLDIIVVDMPQL
jgi:hypothetical protein